MRGGAREAVVLMYHRICPRLPETACWFARGTAVTPEHFAAHIESLSRHVRFVQLEEALASAATGALRGGRPACALTFDDGYRDIEVIAKSLPVTVFAVADPTQEAGEPLWFDRFYAILHRARRRVGMRPEALGLANETSVPGLDENLRWWVRGPVKSALHTMDTSARRIWLNRLAEILDSVGAELLPELYLQRDALRALVSAGHRVGGHGATHTRLTELADDVLASEIAASRALVDSLGMQPAMLFCYPDGACDARVAGAVAAAGFQAACGVEEAVVTRASERYAIPRIFMRDVEPDAPGWPPALARFCGTGVRR